MNIALRKSYTPCILQVSESTVQSRSLKLGTLKENKTRKKVTENNLLFLASDINENTLKEKVATKKLNNNY